MYNVQTSHTGAGGVAGEVAIGVSPPELHPSEADTRVSRGARRRRRLTEGRQFIRSQELTVRDSVNKLL